MNEELNLTKSQAIELLNSLPLFIRKERQVSNIRIRGLLLMSLDNGVRITKIDQDQVWQQERLTAIEN